LEDDFLMKDLLIVIPLGVSTPGTPNLNLLKHCVWSLKEQKTNYQFDVIFACDNNVSDDVKEYLNSTGYKISWYDPYYFFRRGSIWKKIIQEWQNNDSEFVAFCHYDDMWSDNKIQSQLDMMKKEDLELSWSRVNIINENNQIVSGDMASRTLLNQDTIRKGQSYAFSHSSILKKDKFLSSGILDYLEKSAPVYEGLHYIFCHKLKGRKDDNSVFYHRVHGLSVSNNLHTETPEISKIREIAEYSLADVKSDEKELNMEEIIRKVFP